VSRGEEEKKVEETDERLGKEIVGNRRGDSDMMETELR
jgi:hypothetical protein